MMLSFDRKLLDLLACPICKGPLEAEKSKQLLICPRCQVAYPIRDGIPILLAEEAEPLEEKS